MPRKTTTPDEKLAKLEQRKNQIEAQIKQAAARKRLQDRKDDTRRKILAGAIALEHALHDHAFKVTLDRLIGSNVKRAEDRALFGLVPSKDEAANKA